MAVRSLNKVILIGNLTRDPELRYTPNGTAVVSFTVATNREWTVEGGEKREEAEFTRCVAWNKLAELCSQLLAKGRKVYIEGRLQTRSWTSQDGQQRMATEVVVNDMIVLDSKRSGGEPPAASEAAGAAASGAANTGSAVSTQASPAGAKKQKADDNDEKEKKEKKEESTGEETKTEEINPDDIPF